MGPTVQAPIPNTSAGVMIDVNKFKVRSFVVYHISVIPEFILSFSTNFPYLFIKEQSSDELLYAKPG